MAASFSVASLNGKGRREEKRLREQRINRRGIFEFDAFLSVAIGLTFF
jgi:hypothetical protein